MNNQPRPLIGCIVGLSISDGEDSAALGFPQSEVNRTALRIVAALLGQGAGVSFGHDWRDDGVMDAVHSYVERFRPLPTEGQAKPLLWNFVPWPDKPRLGEAERARLKDTLTIEEVGLPETLRDYATDRQTSHFAYLRARGLTHLRRKLDEASTARVCLGGRLTTYAGRYPGIVEESLFSLHAGKPLYLAGFLGGAAQQEICALRRENRPRDLCPSEEVLGLYRNPPIGEPRVGIEEDSQCSPEGVWQAFANVGVDGLSKANGLSVIENERLFNAQIVDEAIDLILRGLGRLAGR